MSEIEPASEDSLLEQKHPLPLLVIVDGKNKQKVGEVLDSRMGYRNLEYRVKWVREDESTWQPAKYLENAL